MNRRQTSTPRLPLVRRRLFLILAATAFAIAPPAEATTYKWNDDRGQVHYSDQPPPGVQYEIVAMPKPVAIPTPSPAVATPPPPAAQPLPKAGPTPVIAEDDLTKDGACVDALYQIALLRERQPIFRQAADGSRLYLEDSARPAELRRLEAVRDTSCSSDPEMFKSQEARARRLMVALSRNCAEARDKLANYQDPSTHTPKDQVERQREWVARNCAGGPRTDVWLGDWIRVGR